MIGQYILLGCADEGLRLGKLALVIGHEVVLVAFGDSKGCELLTYRQ